MKHRICTTLETGEFSKVRTLRDHMDEISAEHDCRINVNDFSKKIRVITNANGAALRDIVIRLDRLGYLD